MFSIDNIPPGHISYQLHIHVSDSIGIRVGALGLCQFPAGHYVYTGSAKRNIGARLRRHLSNKKKLRWHIDYLLDHPLTRISEIFTFSINECSLNQRLEGKAIVSGFGSSDCRNHCGTHLKYLGIETTKAEDLSA